MIQITPHLTLDEAELEFDFVRASGPGGQNVNKVSSAVVLRYDLVAAALPADVRQRLITLAGKRVTADGVLMLKAQQFRTQERNRQDAIDRLVEMIQQAAVQPRQRIPTRPTRASQRRRVEQKRQRGEIKQLRRSVPPPRD